MKPHTRYLVGEKIMYFSMIYFAAVLPFQFRILSPTIGIIGILLGWLISFRPKQALLCFKKNVPLWFVSGLYLLGALSYFYTEDKDTWGRLMVLKMPTLLLPLALGTSAKFGQKHYKHWLLTFAFSTALSCLVLFSIGLYRQSLDPSQNYLYHQSFVAYHLIAVHYFTMYCSFAFIILLYYYLKARPIALGKKTIFFLSLAALAAAIYVGAARMQIVTFLLISIIFITWYFGQKKSWKKLLIYQMIALGGIVGLALIIPGSQKRIIETYREWMVYEGKSDDYQTNHRVFIWRDAMKVIEQNPLQGEGLGSADNELNEYLKLETAQFWRGNRPYTLGETNYNYHNTYLQHWAALGILGLTFLVMAFLWPFIKMGKYSFLAYAMLFILGTSFITESMLERQAGTLFFAYFFAMLIANANNSFRPSALSDYKKPA
ncbi:O-antigen ligase family protein [Owenweeksia hongkongensis]|uniref:O-antigen ligase family protein n=1 Tax=Owenweeksia hongkongensis TaxID=253245 RepID=UPI003A9008B9